MDLRAYLEGIGDCVVVVDDDEIIKVHVHTEEPGNALQAALTFGQLLTVKIENMKEQHRKAAEENEANKAKAAAASMEPVDPTEEVGFVAVAAGDGLQTLFTDLGCTRVVSGGQTMNPSTDDIYAAVLATPAKTVLVLPNNKNIIMAAEQTISMVNDRKVIVLPTRTIPQGLSENLLHPVGLHPGPVRGAGSAAVLHLGHGFYGAGAGAAEALGGGRARDLRLQPLEPRRL